MIQDINQNKDNNEQPQKQEMKEEGGEKQQNNENIFTEEENSLLKEFMQIQANFTPPPMNYNLAHTQYRDSFAEIIQSITDHYSIFDQTYHFEKKYQLKPNRTITSHLRADLKFSAYQIFNSLLDVTNKLSQQNRQGSSIKIKQTPQHIKKFLRDISDLKLYYLRKQIRQKIQMEIKRLNKETQSILDIIDEMKKFIKENKEDHEMEDYHENFQIQQFNELSGFIQ